MRDDVDVLAALAHVVDAGPDRLAVVDPLGPVTYRELWRWAGAIGTWLKGQGVQRGDRVGLATPRAAAHVAGMLGAWWAGAAFVPLPPELPSERRRWIEAAAAPAIVLEPAAILELRDHACDLAPPARPAPDDLAYVLFTSGSSGRPKGVRIAHRGLLSLLRAQIAGFRHHPGTRALFVLSPAFDAAISDVGTVLLAGGALVIAGDDLLRDPDALARTLAREQITAIDLPPALLGPLERAGILAGLETVILGGEPSPPALVRRAAARVRVVNVYGPTEATICVSLCACDPIAWDRPLLGDPLPGVRFHLLDRDGAELSLGTDGVEGELAISGPCLALGYLDRPEEDAARFLERGGLRLYRTGDRVRVASGGGLEFRGRLDRQRKIGGVRIELDEVEAALAGHPDVAEAAVDLDREGHLVALVAPRAAARDFEVGDLEGHLRERLPAAARPRRILVVDALPRGVSGKVDRPAIRARLDPPIEASMPDAIARERDGGLPATVGDAEWACDLRPRVHPVGEDLGEDRARDPSPVVGVSGEDVLGDMSIQRAPSAGLEPERAEDPVPCEAEDPARALLAGLWRRVLGVAEVRPGDRFTDLGGGSFAALELVALADAVGLGVSAPRLLGGAPFAAIADELRDPPGSIRGVDELQADVDARLAALRGATGPSARRSREMSHEAGSYEHVQEDMIDRFAGDPAPAIEVVDTPRRAPTIFLTGATGSLGGAVLRDLADRHPGRVLCLVRACDPATARDRLRAVLGPDPIADVAPVVGDLAEPHLGLEAAAWGRLCDEVDHIVHVGALVHLARGYEDHRPANLDGTATILELAVAAGARGLHYVSTLSVFVAALPAPAEHDVDHRPDEDDPLDRARALIGGYAQSKWAAERLVRAFAPGRLRTTVLRPGLVVGAREPALEQLTLCLRGLAELGVVPRGHERLRVDLTPIDVVARGLVALVLEDLSLETDLTPTLDTLHLAAPRPASAADLVAALRRRGVAIREVDPAPWRALAHDVAARSPAAAVAYLALCRALDDDAHRRLRPYDLFQATGFALAGPRGDAALARHGLAVPEVTAARLDDLVGRALAEEVRR